MKTLVLHIDDAIVADLTSRIYVRRATGLFDTEDRFLVLADMLFRAIERGAPSLDISLPPAPQPPAPSP